MNIKILAVSLCAVLALSLGSGCGSTKLESGGAYAPAATNGDGTVSATLAPDLGFYVVDSAFELAYSTVDAAFAFERNNRAALWKLSPEVKHGLDAVRLQASLVRLKYAQARQAYTANPVPANLELLQQVLGEAQALAAATAAALPQE